MQSPAPQRIRLLGAEVDLITPGEMLDALAGFISGGTTAVVANHNAHSLYLMRRRPDLRAFFETADLIEIDSRPMIAWGRLMGLATRGRHRCTYLDWRDAFWDRAEAAGWRVFYLGGTPGVAETARERLLARWPRLKLGCAHGYFDASPASAENAAVVAAVRAYAPDIVLVGMGMPRQELWIAQNRAAFDRGVFFSLGAAFDYEAGVQQAAPRWLGRMGLEWLYRLLSQPRRLAFRYLVEPWFLVPAMAEDVLTRLGLRRPPPLAPGAGVASMTGAGQACPPRRPR